MTLHGALISLTLLTASLAAHNQLNRAIGSPTPRLYKYIDDAKNWRNPWVYTLDDGVEVRATCMDGWTHLPVEGLKQFLIDLPVDAWPYGRVVAQSGPGPLPSPAEEFLRRQDQTKRRVAVVLKDLHITVVFWPGA